MNEDLRGFILVAHDKDYEMKLFIENAIKAGAIVKEGRHKYLLPEGDKLGSTLASTVDYLTRLKETTDDVYLTIQARIENNK